MRCYWQRLKRGDEVAYKEIAAFSIGPMGLKGYGSLMTNYIQMAAMCLLTGTVYGLSPTYIMILYIITNVVGVIKTPCYIGATAQTRTFYFSKTNQANATNRIKSQYIKIKIYKK